MNRDEIKGKYEEIKGEVKQKIGETTGDRSTQAEGMVDEAKGHARQGVGKVEEKLERERREADRKDGDV
jgi:uncharacterized protein YjbJ (UPF0337 family)